MFLRQVKSYITVVECHSFTAAAKKCNVSQSAISQQIFGLEDELGVSLIVRSNRGFTLTPAGRFFYDGGLKLLEVVGRYMDATRAVANMEVEITLAVHGGLDGRDLGKTVSDFKALYRNCEVDVRPFIGIPGGKPEEEGCDIYLSFGGYAAPKGYAEEKIGELLCMAEISSSDPLAKCAAVSVDRLAGYTCVLVGDFESAPARRDFYARLFGRDAGMRIAKDEDEAAEIVAGGNAFRPVAFGPYSPLVWSEGLKYADIQDLHGNPLTIPLTAHYKMGEGSDYTAELLNFLKRRTGKNR